MFSLKRGVTYLVFAFVIACLLIQLNLLHLPGTASSLGSPEVYRLKPVEGDDGFTWANYKPHYPVESYQPLPKPNSKRVPPVQHAVFTETAGERQEREGRLKAVKEALQRSWNAYRKHAWLEDELAPISGGGRSSFGGWSATLVDSLDTLWIMDLKEEFYEAADATLQINFSDTSSTEINVFETTIRYFGGFLSAYDLSGDKRLLDKSLELANMLYAAFDTPTHMPITRWDFHKAAAGKPQMADLHVLVAEIGSLTLEFTRLAQITNDAKWYDAVARITEVFDSDQHQTNLPGFWPLAVNAQTQDFHSGSTFTLGAMADSVYEYLPKMYALLGGSDLYAKLYNDAMDTAMRYALFRPMLPDSADVLMSGPVTTSSSGDKSLHPDPQHLVCFAGGMFALGGKLMQNESHVEVGRKLTDGCVWTYENSELGIMPEAFTVVPCKDKDVCPWDQARWESSVMARHQDPYGEGVDSIIKQERLRPGFTSYGDRRYVLRPEAIESVFVLSRVTGDKHFQDAAWNMFQNVYKHTKTELAHAALIDTTDPKAPKYDSMETFWTAETLKYYYLTFSDPSLISLDEYVFNTEAHPFKRMHAFR